MKNFNNTNNKIKLFSGIQPTGILHIGNYFGAIKNWVKLQKQYSSLFCIVDYHSLTIPFEPKKMSKKILDIAIDLIACGIDPVKSILFIQSSIPEHTELTWILSCFTPLSELHRMTQFKEKSQKNIKNVNAGLLYYPILMAADILLYKAEVIPVGNDQLQHIEMARTIARRFNKQLGKTFPEPKGILTSAPRIMSLTNAKEKMSKSGGINSYIALSDSLKTIEKKLSIAVTDPARKRITDSGTPEKCNLYHLHKLVSNNKDLDYISKGCCTAKIGCLECKKLLAKNIFAELKPIQKRKKELQKNPGKIKKILQLGATRARKIAKKNMLEIKKKIGLYIP
ncbi:tryptophan--tRNA ligase [Candidatus Parcubacteria bacterium 4484_255]|nr:MAG: tryptophan--tRNA ligase [Candidatus Parcubacteria bacterium 4484_255]